MGFLTLSRREGEMIRLTIDPGVDTEKLLKQLLRDGITVHIGAIKRHGRARISIEAPKQMAILRDELVDA
ncbi:TPA: carbon storage regulator [Pseudomonas aeruginosa]|nr:carbon storage regulator [Pseudomonas aeruginosa]